MTGMTAPARLVSRAGAVVERMPHALGVSWRGLGLGAALVLLAGEVVLAAPTLGGAVGALGHARVGWLAAAVLAEMVSMGLFARTRRRLMAVAGVPVRMRDTLAGVYVSNALHLTLPGGTAFSTAYNVRWLRERGAPNAVVGWVLAAGGLLSTSALVGLGLVGSVLVGRGAGTVAAVVDVAALAALVAAVRVCRRRPDVLSRAGRWVLARGNRLLRCPPDRGVREWDRLVGQLRSVRPSAMDWTAAGAFAVGNWVFDVVCLAAGAAALGVHGLTLPLLLIAYTAGMAASGVTLLPGGIGVVEPAMVVALVAGGIPASTALPAVLLYRLISLVGVVGAGWIVLAVQARPRRHRAEVTAFPRDREPVAA